MIDDNKIPFLVIATVKGGGTTYRRPFFVRAESTREAYIEALQSELFQHPDVHFEAYVISAGELAEALDLKSIARFYHDAGRAHPAISKSFFDELWDEHGAAPEPNPDDA